MSTLSDIKEFQDAMSKSSYVLLNFYEDWHEPCKKLNALLSDYINKEYVSLNVPLLHVEVSKFTEFTESFNVIESIPTLVLLSCQNKKIIAVHEGDDMIAIKDMLKKYIIPVRIEKNCYR